MNANTLRTIALVGGLLAAFIGVWGLVAPGAANQAEIEEGFRWVAGALLALAVSAICSALAGRSR